ncbi:MAG TPA: DivIVA domain-containing protein [Candidatus Nanopelagicales bacterium]|nr:DivIVA domain-containing protein [Candidatus Nanopelagicales bacterium]
MPLTPEDVANKQFTSTRLKPGYDETEVDEFLDEVEAELTRLYRENDELRSKLAAAGRGEAPSAPPQAAPAPSGPSEQEERLGRENEELRSKLGAMQRQLAEAQARPATTQQVAPPAPQPTPAAPAAQQAGGASETATGILALAQRTADEHIAEARTQADRIISEARTRAEQLKREAEDKHRQTIGSLETERSSLERKVEGLRAFEREYRGRLKSYLEGQLRELDSRSSEAPGQQGGQAQQGGGQGGQGQQGGQGGQGQPGGRSPFAPGAPVGGGDSPSGPPQQPGSGFALDDGERRS